jgi:type I restriction enzyme S subunit
MIQRKQIDVTHQMKSIYSFKRLCDIGVTLFDCDHRTPKPTTTGYPYIAIPQIQQGRLYLSDVRLISKEDYESWTQKNKPQAGDIIVTRRARVGDTAVIPDRFECAIGQNLVILRSDGSQVDQSFLRWALRGPYYEQQMSKFLNVGALFNSLNCGDIPQFELPIPPLPTQHAIARILGSLDDKIELNRQMNETLEAMARAIFQSWFVDFDPVRAKAEGRQPAGMDGETAALFPDGFEEVDGREVPRGWRIGFAEDICEIISDGSHYSPKENDDGPCLIGTVKDMDDFDFSLQSCKRITIEDYEKLCKNDCKPKCGDVLLSKDGTMGKPHLCVGHQDLVILSSIAIFRPKNEIHSHYLYWFLKSEHFQSNISTYSSGSVLTRMVCRDLKKIEILLPDEKILQKFLSHVKVLHSQIIQNCEQSRTLAQIRDALLPKLMSGEIKVGVEGT